MPPLGLALYLTQYITCRIYFNVQNFCLLSEVPQFAQELTD